MAKKEESFMGLYESDIAILKDYGGIKQKLTLNRSLRRKGFELDEQRPERGTCHLNKLDESLSRTRSTLFELAYCNEFELFVTLTLNPKKYDRNDLKKFKGDLGQWLSNYNKKYKIGLKYLLIPEMHKDGNWHMHGFIMGLPLEHLTENENGYLDWFAYKEKFGFISIDHIRNREAAAKYMTKYITKDLSKSVTDLNANMYYCSQGLKRSQEIKRGSLVDANVLWDFTNDYCKVKWLSSSSDNDILID